MTNKIFVLKTDSFGEIKVPANAYYAAQTQRSVQNFQFVTIMPPTKCQKKWWRPWLLVKKAALIQ